MLRTIFDFLLLIAMSVGMGVDFAQGDIGWGVVHAVMVLAVGFCMVMVYEPHRCTEDCEEFNTSND